MIHFVHIVVYEFIMQIIAEHQRIVGEAFIGRFSLFSMLEEGLFLPAFRYSYISPSLSSSSQSRSSRSANFSAAFARKAVNPAKFSR